MLDYVTVLYDHQWNVCLTAPFFINDAPELQGCKTVAFIWEQFVCRWYFLFWWGLFPSESILPQKNPKQNMYPHVGHCWAVMYVEVLALHFSNIKRTEESDSFLRESWIEIGNINVIQDIQGQITWCYMFRFQYSKSVHRILNISIQFIFCSTRIRVYQMEGTACIAILWKQALDRSYLEKIYLWCTETLTRHFF